MSAFTSQPSRIVVLAFWYGLIFVTPFTTGCVPLLFPSPYYREIIGRWQLGAGLVHLCL